MSCSAVITPALFRLVFGFVSHHVMIIDSESQRFEGRNIILIVTTLVIHLHLFFKCKNHSMCHCCDFKIFVPARCCHTSVHTPLSDIRKKYTHSHYASKHEFRMHLGPSRVVLQAVFRGAVAHSVDCPIVLQLKRGKVTC